MHPTGSRPSPAGARPGSTPPWNQGDPPCSFPPWPRMTASSDRFWLCELRVSQHFSTFYGPSVQAMDAQLGARHRRWTPMIHRGRARRTISAGSWFGQWSPDPPVLCDRSSPSPRPSRVTWRPPLSRMAGPGDPRPTCPRPSARHLETSGRPNGGVGDHCPNQRNKSERKENIRQPQLCSMPVSLGYNGITVISEPNREKSATLFLKIWRMAWTCIVATMFASWTCLPPREYVLSNPSKFDVASCPSSAIRNCVLNLTTSATNAAGATGAENVWGATEWPDTPAGSEGLSQEGGFPGGSLWTIPLEMCSIVGELTPISIDGG